jgi:hypothetical protein
VVVGAGTELVSAGWAAPAACVEPEPAEPPQAVSVTASRAERDISAQRRRRSCMATPLTELS